MTDKNTISKLKSSGQNLETELILQIKSLSPTPIGCNLELTDESDSIKSLYLGKKNCELFSGDFIKIVKFHFKPEIFENPLIFFDFSKQPSTPKSNQIQIFEEKKTPSPASIQKSSALETTLSSNFSYSTETPHLPIYTLSTFQQILSLTLKPSEKLVFFTLCTIGLVQRDRYSSFYYVGCKNNQCKKKVEKIDLNYFCPKCKYFGTEFRYRYNVNLPLMDLNRIVYARVFDKFAEKLFGVPTEVFVYRVSQNKADKLVFNLFGKKIIAETRVAQAGSGHVFELINTHDALTALPTILFELSLCK